MVVKPPISLHDWGDTPSTSKRKVVRHVKNRRLP